MQLKISFYEYRLYILEIFCHTVELLSHFEVHLNYCQILQAEKSQSGNLPKDSKRIQIQSYRCNIDSKTKSQKYQYQ